MEQADNNRRAALLASYGADRSRWPATERGLEGPVPAGAEAEARAVDHLRALASAPLERPDALARLMARIDERPTAEVILFAPRRRSWSLLRYAAAVPLAASLLLGAYLGASGSFDFMLPSSVTGGVALNDDAPDDLGGVDDVVAIAQDGLT